MRNEVKKINDDFQLLSDTKITDSLEVRKNALASNLKAFILNPKTCVSFAGNVFFAEKFLKHFYSLKIYNLSYILEYCLQLNRESSNSIEFGIIYINENNQTDLYKIKNGQIDNNQQNFWLGDNRAFDEFQKEFLKNGEDLSFNNMSKAFNDVISKGKIETVGNFIIGIISRQPKGWNENFLFYREFVTSSIMPNLLNKVQSKPIEYIPMGNAEHGGYSECYLSSLTLELPAVAIHFYQGMFGILFCPAINYNHPIVVENQPDPKAFANYIKGKYNITLSGLVVENGTHFKRIIGE